MGSGASKNREKRNDDAVATDITAKVSDPKKTDLAPETNLVPPSSTSQSSIARLARADKILMAEFNRRDIDKSGTLSRDEIETFLKDIEWGSLSADDVFQHHDKNHDESITAEEFFNWQRAAWVNRSNMKTTARVIPILHKMFRQHADEHGDVTVTQLNKMFHSNGLGHDAHSVFAFADQDLSASVSLADYMAWQHKQWHAQQNASAEDEVVFDANKSTEELYTQKDQTNEVYTPAYARERSTIDYSYHKRYTFKRQQVQDQISHHYRNQYHVQGDHKPVLPWLLFTAGAMGCGKGYVKKWLAKQKYLPLDMFVQVDMDDIRARLPEWPQYLEKGQATAGQRTQKEAGMIAELVTMNALRRRRNILLDGSLRNKEYYSQYLDLVRAHYPGVRVGIMHVTVADEAVVQRRVLSRAKEEGRVVPPAIVTDSFNQVPKSVAYFAENYCDFCCRIANEDNSEPQLVPEPSFTKNQKTELTWTFFKSLWVNESIDLDGDGILSRTEVNEGVAHGYVSRKAVKSMDANGDGILDLDDIALAEQTADLN